MNQSTDFAPVVKLPNGNIKGLVSMTIAKRPYWAYQKIPFATPPLGDLRFEPPIPPKNWNGVLETTKMDVICYQVPTDSDMETEDCLYLNVYTPRVRTKLFYSKFSKTFVIKSLLDILISNGTVAFKKIGK